MKAINITVSDELKDRLDEVAQRENRTQKAVIVRALERYLSEAEESGVEAA